MTGLQPHRPLAATLVAAALLLATACGGGGSDGSAGASSGGSGGSGPATPPPRAAWTPAHTDTWQWQLLGRVNTGYDVVVYDIDLFDVPQATLDTLKTQGHAVVCYFSAGSAEDWRPDYAEFASADLGHPLDGWPGERWVDTRSSRVRDVMRARLDLAVDRGCDGVEPDNMDGYQNQPGFPLDAATQLDFNRFIASEARARGLRVGLKNDVDQLAQLVDHFDFAVNEQCHQYDECDGYAVFIAQDKPVFNAEYASRYRNDEAARAALCSAARAAGLRTLVLPLDLDDSFRHSCD